MPNDFLIRLLQQRNNYYLCFILKFYKHLKGTFQDILSHRLELQDDMILNLELFTSVDCFKWQNLF